MSEVNLKFRNNSYTVNSDTPEKLQELADKVNSKADSLAGRVMNIPDAKLAFLAALMAEDEIETLHAQIANQSVSHISDSNSDQEVCELMDGVSGFVEQLSKRIEKI